MPYISNADSMAYSYDELGFHPDSWEVRFDSQFKGRVALQKDFGPTLTNMAIHLQQSGKIDIAQEAMTVADRIAVIADGRLVEEGSPRDIYERPERRFTADFIGEAKVFDGRVTTVDGDSVRVDIGIGEVAVMAQGMAQRAGDPVAVSVRSELLGLLAPDEPVSERMQTLRGVYARMVYLGLTTSHIVELADGSELTVCRISRGRDGHSFQPGAEVCLGWQLEDARLHTS